MFRKALTAALLIFALAISPSASYFTSHADEGMWLFNNVPKKLLKEKYGFEPTDAWLEHLQKSSVRFNSGGSGSVRQRTYYDDLAALKLPLPELDEQKAIAAVLNTARADLAATEREIEAVTLQKRGLMQKLLTGEWRVPLDPAETSAATEETEHAG